MTGDEAGQEALRAEVGREAQKVEAHGVRLVDIGLRVLEQGQMMTDLGRSVGVLAGCYLPDHVRTRRMAADLRAMNAAADALAYEETLPVSPVMHSTAGTAVYSAMVTFERTELRSGLDEDRWAEAEPHVSRLEGLAGNSVDVAVLEELMRYFGLDSAPNGKNSALQLMQTAYYAYMRPAARAGVAVTTLIPIREATRLTVDYLLKARPHSEQARSWELKVGSIGRQLGWDSLPSQTIASWGTGCRELMTDLSEAKEGAISRERCWGLLVRGLLYLQTLLEGMDPSKVRRVGPLRSRRGGARQQEGESV